MCPKDNYVETNCMGYFSWHLNGALESFIKVKHLHITSLELGVPTPLETPF